jgi:uncharacterized short protein YbdD (DUF466 family)
MRYENLVKLIKEVAETQPNMTIGEFARYIKTKG